MPATDPGHAAHEGSQGQFERWSINRSFSMLGPLGRIGLVVVLLMLLVIDPLLYRQGVWGPHAQHRYLVLWHVCAAIHFAGFGVLPRHLQTLHGQRQGIIAFLALCGALITRLGVI